MDSIVHNSSTNVNYFMLGLISDGIVRDLPGSQPDQDIKGQVSSAWVSKTKSLLIYDYVVTGSKVKRNFVPELDTSDDIVVYAKLPKGFFIPTPVDSHNPDWAISFKEGKVKYIYFVAETKESLSSLDLRGIEITRSNVRESFSKCLIKSMKKNM